MRNQSVVFSEIRTKMPMSARRNIKTNWMSCMEDHHVVLPTKFPQFIDFLLSESDNKGIIFATISEIEERANIPYKTVSKSLHLLEKYKLITKRNGIILLNFK